MTKVRDFVFRQLPSGKLEFVGDFEGLYKNESDPWSQSGKDGDMSIYYEWSRQRLLDNISPKKNSQILEIGCGLGFVTKLLSLKYPYTNCYGLDISKTAIYKAKKLFPNLNFIVDDISSETFNVKKKYDIIILSQILWYILEEFPTVLDNCNKIMKDGANLIITQAFLKKPQRYGKDIIDGFYGLKDYLIKNLTDNLSLSYLDYDDNNDFIHHDGIIVLRKI